MIWITFTIALAFAGIHLFAGKIRFLSVVPRSAWLSVAGGIGVAYVFVHLLPEAATHGRKLRETRFFRDGWLERLESPVFLVALLGLVGFYGLERWVIHRQKHGEEDRQDSRPGEGPRPLGVFWLHVGSFAFYNMLVAYLLVRETELGGGSIIAYALALGLHFVINDFAMHQHHAELYRERGRWLLAAAAPVGWGIGVATPVHPAVTAILFGFLCGGIVLNSLKEELPKERESNYLAFCTGALAFAGLLLLI